MHFSPSSYTVHLPVPFLEESEKTDIPLGAKHKEFIQGETKQE